MGKEEVVEEKEKVEEEDEMELVKNNLLKFICYLHTTGLSVPHMHEHYCTVVFYFFIIYFI